MNSLCVAKPQKITPKMKKKYNEEYIILKKQFMNNTRNAAKTVTALSLFSCDVNLISSVCLGALSSTLYASEYVKYVDNLNEHNRRFPFHVGIPLAMVLTETAINHSSLNLNLDYIETFAAFFSYKYALFVIMIDSLKIDE